MSALRGASIETDANTSIAGAPTTPENRMRIRILFFLFALGVGVTGWSVAADVVIQPAAGSGFVVKDAGGANERLRVQENGQVSLPGVGGAAAQTQALCIGASGLLGPCGGAGSYAAGVGLALSGTTFSVAPSFQLPQTCAANQIAQWNTSTSTWVCASLASGLILPAGTVNQTLRYDSSNALTADSELQVFADGGVLATDANVNAALSADNTPAETIPASGAGSRMMWYPAKAAFRVGFVRGTEWDDANIGFGSTAIGSSRLLFPGPIASGPYSVALGIKATASGLGAMAMGGGTIASGGGSIAMGNTTTASGTSSTAFGSGTIAAGEFSTAMGEGTSADCSITPAYVDPDTGDSHCVSTAMGWKSKAQGNAAMAMGQSSTASGQASVAIGSFSYAGGNSSTAIGSGGASGVYSTAIGRYSSASASESVAIGGGTAGGISSIALGHGAQAYGDNSLATGYGTFAQGKNATAMGFTTSATGDFSMAMGVFATAADHHSFVWNGDNSGGVSSSGAYSFTVNAPGGIYLHTGPSGSGGCVLSNPGSAGWACSSDRDLKTGIEPVDNQVVLAKLLTMPVSRWAFKTAPNYAHIGPMAQDFKTAFDLGDGDDKHIGSTDAQGIAFAAIQGLDAKFEQMRAATDEEIVGLRSSHDKQIEKLQHELADARVQIAALSDAAREIAAIKAQLIALRRATPVLTAVVQP